MTEKAVELLKRLVATPSLSRQEKEAADLLEDFLRQEGCEPMRFGNNLAVKCDGYDPSRPTLMLNSHIDTVKPSPAYTFDPFDAHVRDGRLYGLGSNDAGASLVSLVMTFLSLKSEPLPFNLLLAVSCEEEVGGEGGMRLLLPSLEAEGIKPDMAIVGEPTGMQPAVGERGLIVLDCVTRGVTGHAARNEGVNAIYRAIRDIEAVRNYRFDRESRLLGPIKVSVTQIEAGRQHNVVPDECRWVVDVRTTDAYTNAETARLLAGAVSEHTEAKPRSTRVQASAISEEHPLVKAAMAIGGRPFVSPTTSDMSLMHGIPKLKIGPGESSRSHSADEYIELAEIASALTAYRNLLLKLKTLYSKPL